MAMLSNQERTTSLATRFEWKNFCPAILIHKHLATGDYWEPIINIDYIFVLSLKTSIFFEKKKLLTNPFFISAGCITQH